MFGDDYRWNYDYPSLAYDCGFAFEKARNSAIDKNKISSIDIDRIIREKDIESVENLIPCLNQFVLDREQAAILDDHFVKIFRLSQLSIEYLLFCKKYLDYTLKQVKEEIAKTKEENKELSLFVEDLKEHIAVLMKDLKEQNAVASFKCQHCNKIFSTEEFLSSHIKRRHSNNAALELETDKLHMEIKELKGRLNSAEKLIQKDCNSVKSAQETESDNKFNELKKIDELQQKFEDLRVLVQSELKVLQTQYNYQEKYEKLFEKMALHNSQLQPNKSETRDLGRRRESTTQTEEEIKKLEECKVPEVEAKDKENIPDLTNAQKQITEFGEALETKITTSLDKIEKQMQSFWNKLHEMEVSKTSHTEEISKIEFHAPSEKSKSKNNVKNTSTIQKELDEEISNDEFSAASSVKYKTKNNLKNLSSFEKELDETEKIEKSSKPKKKNKIEKITEQDNVPPSVKPRSKYTVKNSPPSIEKEADETKKIKEILSPRFTKKSKVQEKTEKLKEKMKLVQNVAPKLQAPSEEGDVEKTISSESSLSESDDDESVTSSESSEDDVAEKESVNAAQLPIKKSSIQLPVKKSSVQLPVKKSLLNLSTKKLDVTPVHKEVEVNSDFDFKKIEVTSEMFAHFKEEVEKIMVNGCLQDLGVSPDWKGLPNRSFQRVLDIIKHKADLMKKTYPNYDKIAAKFEKEINRRVEEKLKKKKTKSKIKAKSAKELKKAAVVSERSTASSSKIEIKNRKMYDTDSDDSEPAKVMKVKENLQQISAPYSAVIEELKTVTTKYDSSDRSASEVHSVKEENVKNEETKGVLKSYPSVASLTKKKVLFNLEDGKDNGKTNNQKETGSTTSVASSVLDGSPKKSKPVKKDKDIEDLSDFDFSDM